MLFQNIAKLCGENGISIAKLERECGFGNATVRGWENGTDPQISGVKKVADYFGVTVDDLLKEDAE